jgi:hypothetical protein
MFSKILIRLIDEAVVPAFYLVAVRIISLIFITAYTGIPVELGHAGFIYPTDEDYLLVNSYSLLYMLIALCLGLLHVVIKSLVFHDTHITPVLAAKLHSFKVQHLIQNSFHLYTQGMIWLVYLYFLTIGAGLMCIFGLLYTWVVYISLGLSILFTYIFIFDVEREVLINFGRKR